MIASYINVFFSWTHAGCIAIIYCVYAKHNQKIVWKFEVGFLKYGSYSLHINYYIVTAWGDHTEAQTVIKYAQSYHNITHVYYYYAWQPYCQPHIMSHIPLVNSHVALTGHCDMWMHVTLFMHNININTQYTYTIANGAVN